MSTVCTYTRAELEALLDGPHDGRMPDMRAPSALLEIVARHAESRGESLSEFVRRAMVRAVMADQIHARGALIRQIPTEDVFLAEHLIGHLSDTTTKHADDAKPERNCR